MKAENVAVRPWLRSPLWDSVWMLSGLWLFAPIAILSMLGHGLDVLLAVSLVTLWLAHRVGTTYLYVTNRQYAELIKTQYVRFVLLPVLIFVLFSLFFFDPLGVVPLSTIDKAKWGLTIYFFVNAYHFSFQHYGTLSLYRARSKQTMDHSAKALEKAYCILVAGVIVTVGLLLKGSSVLSSTFLDALWKTSAANHVLSILAWPAATFVALATLALLYKEWSLPQRSGPKMLYLLSMGLQGMAVFYMDPVPFFILWAVQHWMVSIGFTTQMAPPLNKTGSNASGWYGFWDAINRHQWGAFLVLVLISMLMAPLFVSASSPEKFQMIGGYLQSHSALTNILLTLSIGSAFVHLNVDRAVFRFSNAEVRKISLPLVFRQAN